MKEQNIEAPIWKLTKIPREAYKQKENKMDLLKNIKDRWNMHAGQLVRRSDIYYTIAIVAAAFLLLNKWYRVSIMAIRLLE